MHVHAGRSLLSRRNGNCKPRKKKAQDGRGCPKPASWFLTKKSILSSQLECSERDAEEQNYELQRLSMPQYNL